ncbi:hypothetical protein PE066_07400 [Ramlibacter tataouinensis]|uniref:4'-phosphopantetheinyl transferase family protein n=1 Tax=Ramlibacter tataouinensis TaxID=94132 RepID=UPI0022F3CE82|nr:hypothetical protein [Ramlibacter tataouinensis]WBY03349.1 hypothetical protein PE066_07400 [Ramlibacter tataouinensis]
MEVWTASPDGLGCGACQAFVRLLDPQERERAARFKFDRDRRAFVVAHAMRRMALGLALAVDPQELRFGSGPHGQPLLLSPGGEDLHFSLTRSRALVAFALDPRAPVGIDAEPLGEGLDAGLLAPYMDSGAQPPQDAEALHEHWTALEAFWKARGLGLAAGQPRIALQPAGDGCFDVLLGEARSATGLVVMRLPAPATHVLSLACRPAAQVRMVELDSLAPAPTLQREQEQAPPGCEGPDCGVDATPRILISSS